jgi:hypothetical protein
LGLVVSGCLRSDCSTSSRGIAGLRANSALWFTLPHSIHNDDLPALRCRPFEPGQSGNPAGRPKGSRNKATLAVEVLLDGEAETITRKAIELAKNGDLTAIRLCLDRIAPPRKDRPVLFALPALGKAEDASASLAAIVAALAKGELTPTEAGELSKLVDTYVRALLANELEGRVAALERERRR